MSRHAEPDRKEVGDGLTMKNESGHPVPRANRRILLRKRKIDRARVRPDWWTANGERKSLRQNRACAAVTFLPTRRM